MMTVALCMRFRPQRLRPPGKIQVQPDLPAIRMEDAVCNGDTTHHASLLPWRRIMPVHREIADVLLAHLQAHKPTFKRSHAYHLAARLHGFHHRQEARRAPDQPLLRTASIVRVLERELPHYEIAPGAVDLPALAQALQQAGTTATIRQRVVKWLTVAEQWAGDPHVLLTAVLSVHGVHLTRADLIRH